MNYQLPIYDNFKDPVLAIIIKAEEPKKPAPVLYTIKQGDSLTKIAEAHTTSVARLWAANPELTSPDLIEPDKPLKIPQADEILAERAMPVSVKESAPSVSRPFSPHHENGLNTYSYGYCTWYAKNMRPDLPNNLGNADTWAGRAAAQGIATGSTPRVGAIGQQGMHVVYITAVNGDTVTVSEMNYVGWNVVSTRTAPASSFQYIY